MEYGFQFTSMSTRIFLMDRRRIHQKLGRFRPKFKHQLFSKVMGFNNAETLEITISKHMRSENLLRLDFRGASPGMWSIHPVYRSKEFYSRIPEMIDRVLKNDIPEDQPGDYNFSMSFIDWSEALDNFKTNRLRNKLLSRFSFRSN